MKLTIIETGKVPAHLQGRFGSYPAMFKSMFEAGGLSTEVETVSVWDGEDLPAPEAVEAIAITGSPAGVYEDHPWLAPLRDFIRSAYDADIPMLGICFGHQIMADALGGVVRKSEKGWGLGRHSYSVTQRPEFMADAPDTICVACSHQDQVIEPPKTAEVILSTPFTPNAGLYYANGKALSFQPHPEFSEDYARALIEWRREALDKAVVDEALASFAMPTDSALLCIYIGRFFAATAKA